MRLHGIAFEIGVEKIRGGQSPEAERVAEIAGRDGGDAVRERKACTKPAEETLRGRARGAGEKRRQTACGAQHIAAVACEGVGVATREARDLTAMHEAVTIACVVAAIRKAGDAAFRADETEAVTRQGENGGAARPQSTTSQSGKRGNRR